MVTFLEPETIAEPVPAPGDHALRRVLTVIIAVAALVLAGGVGYTVADKDSTSLPTSTSVDAGFAWDMSVHHLQAVTMANFVRDHTTNTVVKQLAFDIETSQYVQVGQMQGWLDTWGLPAQSTQPQMAWMASSGHQLDPDGLMPGMATPAQMAKLQTLSGDALNVFFLQLMLHHHQGGLPMAQYAAKHASEPYVRNAADKMAVSQSNEIVQMEQLLRQDGASPLPPAD